MRQGDEKYNVRHVWYCLTRSDCTTLCFVKLKIRTFRAARTDTRPVRTAPAWPRVSYYHGGTSTARVHDRVWGKGKPGSAVYTRCILTRVNTQQPGATASVPYPLERNAVTASNLMHCRSSSLWGFFGASPRLPRVGRTGDPPGKHQGQNQATRFGQGRPEDLVNIHHTY